MSVLFAHLGGFAVKLRQDRRTTSVKRKCERERERESDNHSHTPRALHLGIKMNCIFTKDMDHCRRQPETLCCTQKEHNILCVLDDGDKLWQKIVCASVYHTEHVSCVFVPIESYIMNQITLIFIVFLRVKTKGHGFEMNRVYDFVRGEREKKWIYTTLMHACIHL